MRRFVWRRINSLRDKGVDRFYRNSVSYLRANLATDRREKLFPLLLYHRRYDRQSRGDFCFVRNVTADAYWLVRGGNSQHGAEFEATEVGRSHREREKERRKERK